MVTAELEKQRRRRERTALILKMVGLGLFMLAIGAVPPPWAIPRIVREVMSKDSQANRLRMRRKIYDLRKRGYIDAGERAYEITSRGEKILDEESLWDLRIPRPEKWAGNWNLVSFDIPMKKKYVRIAFIRHLQNLGLTFYQRSLWVYPHPCEKEVRKIAVHYGILPHVSFITATRLDNSAAFTRRFKIG